MGSSASYNTEIYHFNIMVMGKSGVGKSFLINSIFKENLSESAIGSSITQDIIPISKKFWPLTIYDTPGLELDSTKQAILIEKIYQTINQNSKTNDINKFIHCIWYCVNCISGRLDPFEVQLIKQIKKSTRYKQIPIIIVLTQCYDDNDRELMIKSIEKNLPGYNIVPIVADSKPFKNDGITHTINAYGINELLKCTESNMLEIYQQSFHDLLIVPYHFDH